MNRLDGKRMSAIFFKYYHGRTIEDPEDMEMLDKLVRAAHIEYSVRNGEPYAEATEIGRNLHYYPMPSQ